MSKVFADEYKKIAAGDAPDLWARIEAGIDEIVENTGIRPAHDVDFTVEEPETVKLEPMSYVNRRQFWHRYGGLLAACLCVGIIAPLVYLWNSGVSYETSSTGAGAMQFTAESSTAEVRDDVAGGGASDGDGWMADSAPALNAPAPEEAGMAFTSEAAEDYGGKAESDRELQFDEASAPEAAGAVTGGDNRDMMTNTNQGGMAYGHSTYTAANDFEMRLFSNKEIYRSDEAIMIWASLEYVGDDEGATIWSGDPYMAFSITDGAGFQVEGLVNEVRKETRLKRGETYSFSYAKSGGYDANAADADYWEAFYSERDLYLPPGEYSIVLNGAFSLSEDVANSPSGLRCELRITVE